MLEQHHGHRWATGFAAVVVRVRGVAAADELHVLVARRLVVREVATPVNGDLLVSTPLVDQNLGEEAAVP